MMTDIPDPGEFAGYKMVVNSNGDPLIERSDKAELCDDIRIIACWAHAAWTAKAKLLYDNLMFGRGTKWSLKLSDEHDQACINADTCLKIAKGEAERQQPEPQGVSA